MSTELHNYRGHSFSDQDLYVWLDLYQRKILTKRGIERKYLKETKASGKLITRLWKKHLGVDTNTASKQSELVAKLLEENSYLRYKLNLKLGTTWDAAIFCHLSNRAHPPTPRQHVEGICFRENWCIMYVDHSLDSVRKKKEPNR